VLRADLARNTSIESKVTVAVWRLGNAGMANGPTAALCRVLHRLADAVWTRGCVGAELPASVIPGPGIRLQHAGRGVIINPAVRIGADCSLYHRVTIGIREPHRGSPVLGDGVKVGAAAMILGAVQIGDRAVVAAGAIVVHDVPAGGVAISPAAAVSLAG
jgi:serine O-acetyltransferase